MKRRLGFLLGLIGALAVAVYLVMQRPGESSVEASVGRNLVTYDSSLVDKMEIRAKPGNVVLEKQAGKWMVVEPGRYKADEAAVMSAVAKGASLTVTSLVSSNPAKQPVFQVDSSATLVKVFEKGTERAAFRVGKPGSSFTDTYVRVEGSNDVYLANEVLTYVFGKPVKDWRDKTIFKMAKDDIKDVRFHYRDTTFTIAQQDSNWLVDGLPASKNNISTFTTALSNFVADEFIDSTISALPPPACTIEVSGTQLRFHAIDANKYLVQSSESPQWFEVQAWRVSQVLKRKKDFIQTGM